MTAARLEELAERLMLGEFTIEDQRDAARCARGWAKVERELERLNGYEIGMWKFNGIIRFYTPESCVKAPTALEAVEAAEVKP